MKQILKAATLALALPFTITSFAQAQVSCGQEQNMRSVSGDVATTIRFKIVGENDETQFKIYWLDYQGKRVFYKHVFAGDTYVQQTYLTHPWLVTAPEPGGPEECIAIYQPRAGGSTITLD